MNRERKNEGDWERWLAAETAGDAAEAEARRVADNVTFEGYAATIPA